MRVSIVVLALALLLPFASGALAGDDDDPLVSDDPAVVARAALAIADAKDLTSTRRLVEVLRRYGAMESLPRHGDLALLAVLDALIRLEAKAPTDALRPLLRWNKHHLHALTVLAVQRGESHLLLSLFDQAGGGSTIDGSWWMDAHAWVAAGNVLARRRPPGFAARLLRLLRLELHLTIRDEPRPEKPGSPSNGYTNKKSLHVPYDFPPVPLYRLTRAEGTALVSGPGGAISYVRSLHPAGKHTLEEVSGWCTWSQLPLEWLSVLARFEAPPLSLPLKETIVWTSSEAYVREATAVQEDIVAEYWRTVQALFERGLVTLEEIRWLGPYLAIHIADERESLGGDYLPELPATELACPFEAGPGPRPGTAPDSVRSMLAEASAAVVRQFPTHAGEPQSADADWLKRFRKALGPLGPAEYVPLPPQRGGQYSVTLQPAPDAKTLEIRVGFDAARVTFILEDEPLPGAWSFRERRQELLDLIVELFSPQQVANERFGRPFENEQAAFANAKEGGVYSYRAGRTRQVDRDWLQRFLKALGTPDPARFYLAVPRGLFQAEYDVEFTPEEGEPAGVRLSFASGLFAVRYSDMGHPGHWTFTEVRPAVLALIKEIFPEEKRSW